MAKSQLTTAQKNAAREARIAAQQASDAAVAELLATFGDTAKVTSTTHVEIPANIRQQFDRARVAFASLPNTRTVTIPHATEDAAVLYVKQLKTYASEHKISCAPKRDGVYVTFRFAKPSSKRTASPVTVTQVNGNAE